MADDLATWIALRGLTAARIGLQRSGASLATAPLLDFRLAHARARDAVHQPLDQAMLAAGLSGHGLEVIALRSAAETHRQFLMRPELGRRLAPGEEDKVRSGAGAFDVAFVIADGLSAGAVQSHARPTLNELLSVLRAEQVRLAPLTIVRHGRVAIGDVIAPMLGADSVVVLIGERPGLSAPDSMGAYLTWRPRPGTTDADRNCISNIRPDGIGYREAAFKLAHLLRAMRKARTSGVMLKDDSDRALIGDR
jgi:ethanolamine ammonia-lyase small subunit